MFGLKPKPKPYSKDWWLQCRADYLALLHFVDNDPIRGVGGFYRLIVEEALNLPAQEDIISLRVFNREIIQSIDSIPNDCMLLFVQLEIIHIKEEKLPFKGSYADHALSRIGLSEPRLLTFATWLNSHPGVLSTALCAEQRHKDQIMQAIAAHEGLSVFVPYFTTRCSRRRLNGLIRVCFKIGVVS